MAFEFSDLLYGTINTILGTEAVVEDIYGESLTITAIDKTRGVTVLMQGMDVETLKPAAVVRVADIEAAGFVASDLVGKEMALNGDEWLIETVQERPTGAGRSDGTVYLFLKRILTDE